MKTKTNIKILSQPGMPTIMANEKAYLDCDCAVWIGIRVDDHQASTAAWPCSPEHKSIVEKFNELLVASLVEPTSRPLVDVCEELLDKAAADALAD